MPFIKQFEAFIQTGHTVTWFNWGWSEHDAALWFVRPLPGLGRRLPTGDETHPSVSIQNVRIEAEGDGSYTHFISVRADATAVGLPPGVALGGAGFVFEAFTYY